MFERDLLTHILFSHSRLHYDDLMGLVSQVPTRILAQESSTACLLNESMNGRALQVTIKDTNGIERIRDVNQKGKTAHQCHLLGSSQPGPRQMDTVWSSKGPKGGTPAASSVQASVTANNQNP